MTSPIRFARRGQTSGADLYAALAARATELDVPLAEFVRPLNSRAGEFLKLIQRSITPAKLTCDRVEALLNGHPIPTQQRKLRVSSLVDTERRPTGPIPDPVDRDPCFRCQVPRDRHAEHGCRRWSAQP